MEVARTFLVRVYNGEALSEAIPLGQALQATFPGNGYYALVSGRSRCAQGICALCHHPGPAGCDLRHGHRGLARDDRFDLYYFWGQACTRQGKMRWRLKPSGRPQPGSGIRKDASLWAKYYLGILYERRSEFKTAQRLTTLRRGRNVDDLHQQVEQRPPAR